MMLIQGVHAGHISGTISGEPVLFTSSENQLIPDNKERNESITVQMAALPLSFIPNDGQTDPNVWFMVRGSGTSFSFTNTSMLFSMEKSPDATNETFVVITQTFIGANESTHITGEDVLPGTANFFIGNDPDAWRSNLSTYGAVRYHDLYPGIDLLYCGNGSVLKREFIVASGVDPALIQMEYHGADSISIDQNGNLNITTGQGSMTESQPVCFQEIDGNRVDVEARYVLLDDKKLTIEIDTYNPEYELVIDPDLIYSTYLGRVYNENGYGITVDSEGNAYVTGRTASTDFPITTGAFQTLYGGNVDVFVTKLNSAGSSLLYSTYLGGTSNDIGYGIAVDSEGNAYVTGMTTNTDFPMTPGAFQTIYGGYGDAFVTKLDTAGSSLLYSTYLGGRGQDDSRAIALDTGGNAYVAGWTDGSFPTTPGSYQTLYGGGTWDSFVTKLDAVGSSLLYSTYIGGSGYDEGYGIAVDSEGIAFVTGRTDGLFPTSPGAFQTIYGGGTWDAFVTKLDAAGSSVIFSTYMGGASGDAGEGVDVDSTGNVYVTGYTSSINFSTTPGSYQTTFGGSSDVFVTKLNSTGSSLLYSTYLGGTSVERGEGLIIDQNGNVYLNGYTASTDFPITPGAYQTISGGSVDAFITKLNSTGSSLLYSTYFGGTGYDEGHGIVIDTEGNAYVIGYTDGSFPTTPESYQPIHGGQQDAFMVKFSFSILSPTITSISPLSAPNTTLVQFRITGSNFQSAPLPIVNLSKTFRNGLVNITATNVGVPDFRNITGTFDLTGARTGTYDLVVKNGDGQIATKSGSFEVTGPSVNPKLVTDTAIVSERSAILSGHITNAEPGVDYPVSFRYEGGATPKTKVGLSIVNQTNSTYRHILTELSPGTTYYYRAVHRDSAGPENPHLIDADNLESFVIGGSPSPTITSISPLSAPNTTLVQFRITGSNFQSAPLPIVNLSKTFGDGQINITGTNIAVLDSGNITGTFDITGRRTGTYDLVVKNGDGQIAAKSGSFEVTGQSSSVIVNSIEPSTSFNDDIYGFIIHGAGFIEESLVTIARPGTAITRSCLYGGPDTISVIYHLQGVPAGIYNVTVTNPDGKLGKMENALTIEDKPPKPLDSKFIASVASGKVPLEVTFYDQSDGNPTSWLWEFGDGMISNEKNPTHTYVNTGYYTVNLTVSDGTTSRKLSLPDYIIGTPDDTGDKLKINSAVSYAAGTINTDYCGNSLTFINDVYQNGSGYAFDSRIQSFEQVKELFKRANRNQTLIPPKGSVAMYQSGDMAFALSEGDGNVIGCDMNQKIIHRGYNPNPEGYIGWAFPIISAPTVLYPINNTEVSNDFEMTWKHPIWSNQTDISHYEINIQEVLMSSDENVGLAQNSYTDIVNYPANTYKFLLTGGKAFSLNIYTCYYNGFKSKDVTKLFTTTEMGEWVEVNSPTGAYIVRNPIMISEYQNIPLDFNFENVPENLNTNNQYFKNLQKILNSNPITQISDIDFYYKRPSEQEPGSPGYETDLLGSKTKNSLELFKKIHSFDEEIGISILDVEKTPKTITKLNENKNTLQHQPIKLIPNGWVIQNKFELLNGYQHIYDVTDKTDGWIKIDEIQSSISEDRAVQVIKEESSRKPIIRGLVEELIPIFLKAGRSFNYPPTEFPTYLVIAKIAQESWIVHYDNDFITMDPWGRGIARIDADKYVGKALGIRWWNDHGDIDTCRDLGCSESPLPTKIGESTYCLYCPTDNPNCVWASRTKTTCVKRYPSDSCGAENIKDRYNYPGWSCEACTHFYTNTTQGIRANIADGLYALNDHYKLVKDGYEKCIKSDNKNICVGQEEKTCFSCEEFAWISALQRYNGYKTYPGTYLCDSSIGLCYQLKNRIKDFYYNNGNYDDYETEKSQIGGKTVKEAADDFAKRLEILVSHSTEIKMWSPIEPQVIDSLGRMTGILNGDVIEDIPFSIYDPALERIWLPEDNDSIIYRFIGTESSNYSLSISSTELFNASGILTKKREVHEYSINWTMLQKNETGVMIKIDKNGDGTFDTIVYSDKHWNPIKSNFSSNITKGFVPTAVSFIDLSINSPSHWLWTFGDGTNSTLQNPIHIYKIPGNYTVSLTVSNDLGIDTSTQIDYIMLAPSNNFITSTASPNGTITPAGSIPVPEGSDQTFTITPNPGFYIHDVQVDNQTVGAVAKYIFRNVTTNHTIHSDFTDIPGQYEINATADSWSIVYPSGNISYPVGTNKTYITQPKPGADLVDVVVDDESEGAIKTRPFTNISSDHRMATEGTPSPGQIHVSFNATPTTGTPPLEVSFRDQSIGDPISWYWQFGDGGISSDKDPVHQYKIPGIFTVSLRAYNNQTAGYQVMNNFIQVKG
ncbi:SBBP repeat-containing protein [Methanospirillum purgamenti]|nr:SBBP repeat-containing protein [Methanospirillum hungatei]